MGIRFLAWRWWRVGATADGSLLTVYTDAVGEFQIPSISSDKVSIALSKPGYFRTDAAEVELKSGVNEANFKLSHETELEQKN